MIINKELKHYRFVRNRSVRRRRRKCMARLYVKIKDQDNVVVAVQEYRYVAYLPGAQYGAWQPWLCGDTERYLSGIHDRIGLVADKFGTEIVIPVVTKQGRDALAFGFELYDIEIISVAQKPVADVALDECVDAMP